ncbi:MAG: hypothetical protein LBL13_13295 [Bacteroidales bacterium]|jgi:hypothetical protein|nr:hypothetical protein [Bacteroidales bacterium]
MSYCHQRTDVGINFNLGFGEQPDNVIREKVANAGCLLACDVNFINRIVTTHTTVTGCNNINVQKVTVTNNAKLKLNPPNEVPINEEFEVELDSELEIW